MYPDNILMTILIAIILHQTYIRNHQHDLLIEFAKISLGVDVIKEFVKLVDQGLLIEIPLKSR